MIILNYGTPSGTKNSGFSVLTALESFTLKSALIHTKKGHHLHVNQYGNVTNVEKYLNARLYMEKITKVDWNLVNTTVVISSALIVITGFQKTISVL